MIGDGKAVDNINYFPYNTRIFFLSQRDRHWLIIMLILIPILANESMIKFKLIRSFFTHSVGLLRVALDTNIGRKSAAFNDEFESMGFCHCNKVIE